MLGIDLILVQTEGTIQCEYNLRLIIVYHCLIKQDKLR